MTVSTLPANRTTANSANDHVSDHNVLVTAYNTQSRLLDSSSLTSFTGTPALSNLNGTVPAWLLDAAATEALVSRVEFPADWTSAHIDFIWAPTTSASGNVVLQALGLTFGDGELIAAAYTTLATATSAVPATQYTAKVTRVVTGYSISPGKVHAFQFARIGGDGADTYAADIGLVAVRFTKAS